MGMIVIFFVSADRGSDQCLKLELIDLVDSILPNLSDASHNVVITFERSTDPSHPCELVFGSPVRIQHRAQRDTKQSKAITPIHLTEKRQNLKLTAAANGAKNTIQKLALSRQSNLGQEISPIDVPPGTPAMVSLFW